MKKRFIDIDPEFLTDPRGDVKAVTDDRAIKNSIIGLVLTEVFSRPFEPNIASSVGNLEFSPIVAGDTLVPYMYESAIGEVVSRFEPRVDFIEANVNVSKPNVIEVEIVYSLVRDPENSLVINFRV